MMLSLNRFSYGLVASTNGGGAKLVSFAIKQCPTRISAVQGFLICIDTRRESQPAAWPPNMP